MKKSKPKPAALGEQHETEGPSRPMRLSMTLEERTELRNLFASAVYKKAFTNAKLMKPSVFALTSELNGALGGQVANNRLHQIQGWEMFEAALVLQIQDPAPPKPKVTETFPDDPFFQSAIH